MTPIVLAPRRDGEPLAALLPRDAAHLAPLIERYDDARDRDLRGRDRRFIAEGERVVRRFLRSLTSAGWKCESLLVTGERLAHLAPLLPREPEGATPTIFVVDEATMTSVFGYRFHGGALAIGERSWHPPGIEALLERLPRAGPARLLVAEGLVQVDNVGALFRNVACFGGHGIVLDGDCADPFLRKTIRFSMGRVFDVPWATSRALPSDLAALRALNVAVIALELDPRARPLRDLRRRDRVAFVVGNESRGLSDATLGACDEVLMIPSAEDEDARSLNVGVASGIALYEAVRAS
jgi:tRNA G18 (ribose-2'-O)-methylase SpoU